MMDVEHVIDAHREVTVGLVYLEQLIADRERLRYQTEQLEKDKQDLTNKLEKFTEDLNDLRRQYDYNLGKLTAYGEGNSR